jgi:hypothetical protein
MRMGLVRESALQQFSIAEYVSDRRFENRQVARHAPSV